MIKFTGIIRSVCMVSLLMFAVGCSEPGQEEIQSFDSQAKFEADQKSHDNNVKAKYYTADLSMLNSSGVSGMAELTLVGDQLTVEIHATGLEPGVIHPQHIHGFVENNRNSKCPPASADTDGDGLVEVGEGAPFYGPVLLPLVMDINDPLSFPTAPDGTINFEQTYTIDSSLLPLQNRAIVLHGMTVDGTYVATLPVACGQISSSQGRNK